MTPCRYLCRTWIDVVVSCWYRTFSYLSKSCKRCCACLANCCACTWDWMRCICVCGRRILYDRYEEDDWCVLCCDCWDCPATWRITPSLIDDDILPVDPVNMAAFCPPTSFPLLRCCCWLTAGCAGLFILMPICYYWRQRYVLRRIKYHQIHARDDNGLTPLHRAVLGNHDIQAQILLEHGARVDIPSAPLQLTNADNSCGNKTVLQLTPLVSSPISAPAGTTCFTSYSLAAMRRNPSMMRLLVLYSNDTKWDYAQDKSLRIFPKMVGTYYGARKSYLIALNGLLRHYFTNDLITLTLSYFWLDDPTRALLINNIYKDDANKVRSAKMRCLSAPSWSKARAESYCNKALRRSF